jgi:hypothetical protein
MTGIAIGLTITIGPHCYGKMTPVMQVACVLGKTRQTEIDKSIRCSSLTPEREEHPVMCSSETAFLFVPFVAISTSGSYITVSIIS